MQTTTASARTSSLLTLFDMHTTFFRRVIEDVSEKDFHNRLNTKANHMAWLAGAAVSQRFMMSSEIDHKIKQTGAELFEGYKGIQDEATYPSPASYLNDWEKISPVAREALISMDEAKLDSEIDMGSMKMSYYDVVTFTIYREANIIGQLTLWRRLLDYPAIKYDE